MIQKALCTHKESLFYRYHLNVITLLLMTAIAFNWGYITTGCILYIFGILGETK